MKSTTKWSFYAAIVLVACIILGIIIYNHPGGVL